MVIQLSASTKD